MLHALYLVYIRETPSPLVAILATMLTVPAFLEGILIQLGLGYNTVQHKLYHIKFKVMTDLRALFLTDSDSFLNELLSPYF